MFKKYITKADLILLIVLVVLGLGATAYVAMSGGQGGRVVIESDKKEFATYSLYEDREVVVKSKNGTNTVVIEGGRVYVKDASCKNQVCANHASIAKAGETIVCLPNKLLVTIEGEGGDGPDVISG